MVREFRIREARHADRTVIVALWRELMDLHRALDTRFVIAPDGEQKYSRHIVEMIRSRDARVLVAEEVQTSRVIAYIMGEIQVRPPLALPGVYGFVSDIYVTAEWRQHGVGKTLVTQLKRWFIARKAVAIELTVSEVNPAAIAFWQAMGLMPFLRLMHMDL
jgi:ribosomal protein S18 acetylase RimI-like enzyme